MPDESIAVVDSGGAATAPVEAPGAPVVRSEPSPMTPAGPDHSIEPARDTAVTSKHLPGLTATTVAPVDKVAPPTLNKDGSVSSAWVDHMIAGLPGIEPAQSDDPEDAIPADFAEFKQTRGQIRSTLAATEMIYTEPDGAAHAFDAIDANDPEAAERVRVAVVAKYPHRTISQLRDMGYIEVEQPQENHLPSDLAVMIPTELWEIAKTIPPIELRDLSYTGQDALIHALKQRQEMTEAWDEQTERADAQWTEAIAKAEKDGQAQVQSLVGMYLDEHTKEFQKWKPTGNEATDATLRNMVFASAINEMLSDPKWANINTAITMMLLDAPKWRLYGESEKANRYELDARQLARQSNVRLGQYIRQHLKALSTILKGVIEEEKPVEKPDPQPPYNVNGKINPDYREWLARQTDKAASATK